MATARWKGGLDNHAAHETTMLASSQRQEGTVLQKGHRETRSRKFWSALDGIRIGSKMKMLTLIRQDPPTTRLGPRPVTCDVTGSFPPPAPGFLPTGSAFKLSLKTPITIPSKSLLKTLSTCLVLRIKYGSSCLDHPPTQAVPQPRLPSPPYLVPTTRSSLYPE